MNLQRVRDLLKRGAIELDLSLPHALTEARTTVVTTYIPDNILWEADWKTRKKIRDKKKKR